jgi:hypothetical protein
LSPGHAVARLPGAARKLAQLRQVVDVAIGLHLRDAEAADTQPADGEAIALALVVEGATADIAAADEGDLHLLDLDGAALHALLGERCDACRRKANARCAEQKPSSADSKT